MRVNHARASLCMNLNLSIPKYECCDNSKNRRSGSRNASLSHFKPLPDERVQEKTPSKFLRCMSSGDSGVSPDNKCKNCMGEGIECTHSTTKKKRGPKPIPKKGIESFEYAHSLVSRILAEPDTYPIPVDVDDVRSMLVNISRYTYHLQKELDDRDRRTLPVNPAALSDLSSPSASPPFVENPDPNLVDESQDPDEIAEKQLFKTLEKISLQEQLPRRHFGMSSHFVLVQTLLDYKQVATGRKQDMFRTGRRPEYWNVQPWQRDLPHDEVPLVFPEPDLLNELIGIYFTYVEVHMPMLHRRTLERSIAEGLHFVDVRFGHIVLAVCALASRYSNDSRNMPNGTDSTHSMGWRWYRQISFKVSTFVEAPRLYDLQLCVLMVMYLQASSIAESGWIMLGVAMRLAQATGAHRKMPHQRRTIERELWIRAFWAIVSFDVFASIFLGRPRVTAADDFDLEFPVDCDQEHWDDTDPEKEWFVQPPHEPSKTSFWIHFIKLAEIAGLAHRLIYPIKKSEHWKRLGVQGTAWNQKVVMELDSKLNAWVDTIPEQVKWDPNRTNSVLFGQSVILYTTYYSVQMQVHKKFIPKPGQDSILHGFPSLAISSNAARSCLHVAEAHQARQKILLNPFALTPSIFLSAIVLLINFWRGRSSNLTSDSGMEIRDVYKCVELIKPYEKQHQGAGRMVDILNGIISVGQLRPPSPARSSFNPSYRASDSDIGLAGFLGLGPSNTGSSPKQNLDIQRPPPSQLCWGPLPFYTNELGVLPPHSSLAPALQVTTQSYSNTLYPHSNNSTRADLSAIDLSLNSHSGPSNRTQSNLGNDDPGFSYVTNFDSPVSTWGASPDAGKPSDSPGEDWSLFMQNVDELLQSTTDFQMPVDGL
ncbi:fungal-specific transcription factor domain-containing protein [Rhodocollybia butyracea]|uniref:Fungal-specific transcription factor domain-containing protein n=1 Tax=Rhodocollybia butyracea TaxID=206335 RepID=A0A9P5TWJ5_9AGAR|nr:fungal-specific transcription factor domain-containing protein [Rhodocollybia butyracea]